MGKKMIVYGLSILVFFLCFAYGPDLSENQRLNQEKQIAQELAIKSDELWILEGKKELSVKTLEISIDRLVLLAKKDKNNLSDKQYLELLNEIERLKAIRDIRQFEVNYDL